MSQPKPQITTIVPSELPNATEISTALSHAFSSALEIAAMPEHSFVAQHKTEATSEDIAIRIHKNATIIKERVMFLLANLKDTAASPHFKATLLNNMQDDLIRFHESIPNYEEEFGKVLDNDCQEFSSIYSPAAYFLDLMRLAQDFIKPPQDPALDLLNRRPDLAQIPLDEEHTETEVPYLQVVNEVMSQNLNKQLGQDSLETIATAKYPFYLPFNLPLQKIRSYLGHFQVDLPTLFKTLKVEDQVQIARESLLLSIENMQLITRPDHDAKALVDAYGIVRNYPSFDGSKSCIEIPERPQPKLDITLEAWICPEIEGASAKFAGIISCMYDTRSGAGAGESGYGLFLDDENGIYFGLMLEGQSKPIYLPSGKDTIKLNTWQHVAGSYDGSTMRVYINGEEKATRTVSATSIDYDPVNTTYIGRYHDNNEDHYFKGKIAEVRIWNDERAADDIQRNQYVQLAGGEEGLMGYWPLDEGNGAVSDNLAAPTFMGNVVGDSNWINNTNQAFDPKRKNLHLDGTSNYIELGDYPNPTIGITLEAWVNSSAIGARQPIITKPFTSDAAPFYAYHLEIKEDGSLYFSLSVKGTDDGNHQKTLLADTGFVALEADVWYHIAATYDGTTMLLYLDGLPYATQAPTFTDGGNINVYATDLTLGFFEGTDGAAAAQENFLSGQIMEARIWERARSQQEIKDFMFQPLGGEETYLAAYFPLNEGKGTMIKDWSKSNDGEDTDLGPVEAVMDFPALSALGRAEVFQTQSGLEAAQLQDLLSPGLKTQLLHRKRPVPYWNGTDTYIEIPNKSVMDFDGDLTIEAWLYGEGELNGETLISKDFEQEFDLTFWGGSLVFYNKGGHVGGYGLAYKFKPKHWYHIALLRDITNSEISLYVNGKLTQTISITHTGIQKSNEPITIGYSKSSRGAVSNPHAYFNGFIAEVRLWNTQRTAEEIAYFKNRPLVGNEQNLVAYWPLNEGKGELIYDKTPLQLNGKAPEGITWLEKSLEIDEDEMHPDILHSLFINQGLPDGEFLKLENHQDGYGNSVKVIEGLNLDTIDRLHRFIRLAEALGWTYTDLDWALRTIQPARTPINETSIDQLSTIKSISEQFKIDVSVVCSFWRDIKTIGEGNSFPAQDLFDQTFNQPAPFVSKEHTTEKISYHPDYAGNPLYNDPILIWSIYNDFDPVSRQIRSRLKGALSIGNEDLNLLANYLVEGPEELAVKSVEQTTMGGSGAPISLFTLDSAAPDVDYTGVAIEIVSGPGEGQVGIVDSYSQSGIRLARVSTWLPYGTADSIVYPDDNKGKSTFRVNPFMGLVNDPSANALTLRPLANSAKNFYAGLEIAITDEKGNSQLRKIVSSDGLRITVDKDWAPSPDAGSRYEIRVNAGLAADRNDDLKLPLASAIQNNAYDGLELHITKGKGMGEGGKIKAYTGSTHTATMHKAWETRPGPDSEYQISLNSDKVNFDPTSSIIFDQQASDQDDAYTGLVLEIHEGAGKGQKRVIAAYQGATRVASVNEKWETQPDESSEYRILVNEGVMYPTRLPNGFTWDRIPADARELVNMRLEVISGNAAGHSATIDAVNPLNHFVEISPPMSPTPFKEAEYVLHFPGGTVTKESLKAIPLQAQFASKIDDHYKDMDLEITLGTNTPETKTIRNYDGKHQIAFFDDEWALSTLKGATYQVLVQGTIQGINQGAIELESNVPGDDGFYDIMKIEVTDPVSGNSESNLISQYFATGNFVNVQNPWQNPPQPNWTYKIFVDDGSIERDVLGLDTKVSNPPDDGYVGMEVEVKAPLLITESRSITAYLSDKNLVIVNKCWDARPNPIFSYEINAAKGAVLAAHNKKGKGYITIDISKDAEIDISDLIGKQIGIFAGPGQGQWRLIEAIDTNLQLTLTEAWTVLPKDSSFYKIAPYTGILDPIKESNTLTIAEGSSSLNGAYVGQQIEILEGMGAGQIRSIRAYDPTTKELTINGNWDPVPNDFTHYRITDSSGNALGIEQKVLSASNSAQGASHEATIVLSAAAILKDFYKDMELRITSGPGVGQIRKIVSFQGGRITIAELDAKWEVVPTDASTYRIDVITGTAAAGFVNAIPLGHDASDLDDAYTHMKIELKNGKGRGQSRIISSYDGQRKLAFIQSGGNTNQTLWNPTPDQSTDYEIHSHAGKYISWSRAKVVLPAAASSQDNAYVGMSLAIQGQNEDLPQVRTIQAYDASTQTIQLESPFDLNFVPDGKQEYHIFATAGKVVDADIATINLADNASRHSKAYIGMQIEVMDAAGIRQQALIVAYDSTNRMATVSPKWELIPDDSYQYRIKATEGMAQNPGANTLSLASTASSINEAYRGRSILITEGTGAGQVRRVKSYNGAHRLAVLNKSWEIQPDQTSVYLIQPHRLSMSVRNLSKLHRLSKLPELLGMSVGDFLTLMQVLEITQIDDIEKVKSLIKWAQWLQQAGMSAAQMDFLVRGTPSPYVDNGFTMEAIKRMLKSLSKDTAKDMIRPQIFVHQNIKIAQAEVLVDRLKTAGNIDASGVVLNKGLSYEYLRPLLALKTEQFNNLHQMEWKGIRDMVVIPDITEFPEEAITIEMWVKVDDHTKDQMLFSYAIAQNPHDVEVSLQRNGKPTFSHLARFTVHAERAIEDSNWHHIAVNWQITDDTIGDGEVSFFIDGKPAGKFDFANQQKLDQGGVVVLGQMQDARGGSFDSDVVFQGSMADVRIWKSALTQAEIQKVMKPPLRGQHPNLVAGWRLDEKEGKVVHDITDKYPGSLLARPTPAGNEILDALQSIKLLTPKGFVAEQYTMDTDISAATGPLCTDVQDILLAYQQLQSQDNIMFIRDTLVQGRKLQMHSMERALADFFGISPDLMAESLAFTVKISKIHEYVALLLMYQGTLETEQYVRELKYRHISSSLHRGFYKHTGIQLSKEASISHGKDFFGWLIEDQGNQYRLVEAGADLDIYLLSSAFAQNSNLPATIEGFVDILSRIVLLDKLFDLNPLRLQSIKDYPQWFGIGQFNSKLTFTLDNLKTFEDYKELNDTYTHTENGLEKYLKNPSAKALAEYTLWDQSQLQMMMKALGLSPTELRSIKGVFELKQGMDYRELLGVNLPFMLRLKDLSGLAVKPELPGRSGMGAALSGKVSLLAGGTHLTGAGSAAKTIAEVNIYNSESKAWKASQLSAPRSELASVAVGDYICLAGGLDAKGNPSKQLEIYETIFEGWQHLEMQEARAGLAASAWGHLALLAGGFTKRNQQGITDRVELFDTRDGRFLQPLKLSARRAEMAAVSFGDLLVFAGGMSDESGTVQESDAVELYNGTGFSKDDNLALSVARTRLSGAALNGQAVFAGGIAGGTPQDTIDIYDYDADTQQLTKAGSTLSLSEARSDMAVTTIGSFILFAGGNNANGVSAKVDIYDTTTKQMLSSPGDLQFPRTNASAIVLGSKVYIMGGNDGTQSVSTAEVLDIESMTWSQETHGENWEFYKEIERSTLEIILTRYDNDQWAKIYNPIRDKLLEHERDVLSGFLIWKLKNVFDDISTLDDLYEYLLIDVKMSSCQEISYVKEALNCLQLYIHRCRTGLEREVVYQIPEEWWIWMANYRIWEANRKVFLYPENYLKPSLRQSATPLFQKLQQNLAQNPITDDAVEDAFLKYMDGLAELDKLDLVDAYYEQVYNANSDELESTIFLLGVSRSQNSPAYYLRKIILNDNYDSTSPTSSQVKSWEPWAKIEAPIHANRARMIYAFGKLFLFWVELTKYTETDISNKKTQKSKISISYSYYKLSRNWSAPTVLGTDIIDNKYLDIVDNPDYTDCFLSIIPKGTTWDEQIFIQYPNIYQDTSSSLTLIKAFALTEDFRVFKIADTDISKVSFTPATNSSSTFIAGLPELLAASRHPVNNLLEAFICDGGGEYFLLLGNKMSYTQLSIYFDASSFEMDSSMASISYNSPTLDSTLGNFYRLTTDALKTFHRDLIAGGIDQLLVSENQYLPELPFLRYFDLTKPIPVGNTLKSPSTLDFNGALGMYLWEIFFHIPFLIANSLKTNQQYEAAKKWYEYIFKPLKIQEKGLRAFWPLDNIANGEVADQLGNYPGDIESHSPEQVWASYFPGNAREVLSFDGTSSYVELSGESIPSGNEITVSFWAYGDASLPQNTTAISAFDASQGRNLNIHLPYNNEVIYFDCGVDPSDTSNYDRIEKACSADDYKNVWTHWAFTKNASTGIMSIYLNGELWHSKPNMTKPISASQSAALGAFGASGSIQDFYRGFLADVRIFNIALSPQEIMAQMSLQTPTDIYWQFTPFRNHSLEKLQSMLVNPQEITVYEADPFDPDAIAQQRMGAYEKAIVMAYIDNIIAWGDQLFTEFTWEAIVEATMLYVLANDILGPKPQPTVSIKPKKAITYREISDPKTISPVLLILENQVDALVPTHPFPLNPVNTIDTYNYFCIPENDQLLSYWSTVQDRLFKIRHCENIEGIVEQLALFQPPIDPNALIAALAGGQSLSSAIAALALPVPHYRFTYLMGQAKELTNALVQLGNSILSVLEKKDAAQLELLHTTQAQAILDLTTQIKQSQIDAATEQITVLNNSKASADFRYTHYQALLANPLSTLETMGIDLGVASLELQVIANELKIAPAIAFLLPDIFGFSDGGMDFGHAAQTLVGLLEGIGGLLNQMSQQVNVVAGYERRSEDWSLQMNLAKLDQAQITSQIVAAQIQQQITQQELAVHQKSIEQNQDMQTYLQGKFTNEALYSWMIDQISTVFFQTYSIAIALAHDAEKCFQFERNSNQSFINFAYWDSLKKGLLSGEKLMLDLNRMEKAYIDQNERRLEIEKTISLLQLDPLALMSLKQNGSCDFDLTEALFDYDFPGHYNRQIKSISITIPAIVGPYQNVQATLIQQSNRIVMQPDAEAVNFLLTGKGQSPDADNLRSNWRPSQQIAISRGVEDTGLFELNFRDERYLPFEGTGAVSSWTLEMPKASNRIDFDSISDVIIRLRYTADSGGDAFRKEVTSLNAMKSYSGVRFFNLAQEFSNEWYAYMSGTNADIDIQLDDKMFPLNLKPNSLKLGDQKQMITVIGVPTEEGSTAPGISVDNKPVTNQLVKAPSTKIEADKPWKFKATSDDEKSKLQSIILIVPFTGELVW